MLFVVLKQNTNLFNFIGETARQGVEEQADGEDDKQETQITEDDLEVGRNGYISSAQIIERVTGTGPWDENDDPGNDSSPDNDIVRSFDQVTWTVNLTTALKEGATETGFTGGVVEFTVSLPEEYAKTEYAPYMEWDVDSMGWIEDASLSEDGITLTGKYSLSETERTVPGAQTLVFVLKLYGVGNNSEFAPTFTFNLAGNEETEKTTITDSNIKISATGKYNIQLHRNSLLGNKTTVDYGQGKTLGRMYGYGFTVQLYNDNELKELKGVELPTGEISFDINLKLERSKFGSSELEDITNEATPILWNYRVNNTDKKNLSGNIEGRNLYYNGEKTVYDSFLPSGLDTGNRNRSTKNSGNIQITQNGSKLSVIIDNYSFDEEFPRYQIYDNKKVYEDNIGTFSVGYMQIFVPDTEASTLEDRNYYLTISDNNMNITSSTQGDINIQVNTDDDSSSIQHMIYKKGTYNQALLIGALAPGYLESNYGVGDAKVPLGEIIRVYAKFNVTQTNDYDIYTANRFVKFDGEAFEPIYYDDGSRYKTSYMDGKAEFKVWYVTKKDGTNWTNQEEMNNANIEDMNIYENIEDIPDDKICIGISFETISGYLARSSGDNNTMHFLLKIKDTATIGKTYGLTQRTWYWRESLDRSTYTITNPDVEWPTPEWDSGNRNYIKTEYDENGQMISGTHSGGYVNGNTVLVVGANLHGDIRTIDETNTEKTNYDLGRNENIVTYSVEPALDANTNLASQIENVTLKAEVTLPAGLTYVPGSSTRGNISYTEPEIIENSDGSRTLTWYLYGVTSGETIEPILFDAQIENNTANNTQFETKFVVSEVIGEDGIAKIGNSEINFRTSTTAINIINMSSYRLYKETTTPIAEANGEITYRVVYQNSADSTVPEFQILDILPYNGDGRGTSYNGTYTLKNVKVTSTGDETSIENLKLYTTTSPEARKLSPKDESIGVSEIWQEKQIGEEINEAVTVIALKGEVGRNTNLEIEITLQTTNNRGGDVYYNQATAQIRRDVEVITTSNVKADVVKREVSGTIWYDTNENGTIDADEAKANRIEVELLKADGSKAVDYNGNEIQNILTNSNGEYTFTNLPMGEYIVEIYTDDQYTLTTANIGTNREINSKFEETEEGEKQSYTITNLNGIQSPEILEENVNAGLVVKDAKIIVKYLEEDSTPETDEDNRVLKEQDEITTYEKDGEQVKYKLGDSYTTSPADIENYISLRNSGNTSGTLNAEETVVTYYYAYNLQNIKVTKVWEDNHNTAQKRPTSIKVTLKDGAEEVKEIVLNSSNFVATEQAGIEGIRDTAEVWQGTIEDVPVYNEAGQRISYTIDEKENEGTLDSYNKTINGMVITNTFTQNTEKIEIPVTKVWEDSDNKAGKRPSNLTLILKREVATSPVESREYAEVERVSINGTDNQGSNSNEWTYTFTDIAKYDENNNEIKYIVEEETPEFYTSIVENVENTEEGQDIIAFRITNTFEVPDEKVSYEVTKIWNDNNNRAGKRPEEVTLVLTGKNPQGEEVVEAQRITLTSENKVGESNSEENIWKGTIENLPKYDENADIINYELSEENLNSIFYTEANTTIDQASKTVTNRFEVPDDTIDVEVTKVWNDSNNAEGVRPENVTLYLTGNGQEKEITLTADNKIGESNSEENIWKGTITDLPKYDVNGNEINYVLDERPVTSEFYTKTNVDQGTKTVTNTFGIPTENIQITVTKIWEDNNNALGKRPENITLQIKNKATGEIVASQLMQGSSTSNDGWSYTFEVPKYAGSTDEVEYEIAEADLNNIFYTAENTVIDQETRTITNRFTIPDATIELPVRKEWNHTNNSYRIPQEIKIQVKDETGAVVAEQILNNKNQTEENVWEYTFTGLKKYNEQAEEKKYTIDEEAVTPGDLDYYKKEIEGTTIKNTYIGPIISAEKAVTTQYGQNYVVEGEEITYIITVKNDGGLSKDVKIQDTIPTGTTFVPGSIEISNNENTSNLGETELESGITVNVPAKVGEETGTTTLSFKVTVQDLENGTDITNIATVDDEQTNTVTHKYVEAIIDANKTATIEHPEVGYVLEGETITYTITVTNTGDLAKRVTVKDAIPTGTSFVENSIKIDNQDQTYTQTDLQNGINVDVPAQGNVVVTFEVTVNELVPDTYEGTITNKANVDGEDTNEVTEEVKKPHVTGVKTSTPASGSTVKQNDPITYVITLTNDGTAPENVTVRDEIPDGTTFSDGSIKVQGDGKTYTIDDLTTYGIDVLVPEKETRTVEFTVTVNDLDNGDKITNIAYVEGEETDPVEHTYVEAIIDGSKASETANGLDYVVEGEKITYTITVTNNGGLDGNAIVKDEAPEGTTFVDGSIKVNNSGDDNYTETDLNTGIEVNVPAKDGATAGTTNISFEVTVDQLPADTYEETIRNTAIVDEEDTNEVTTTVNKPNVIGTKESNPASGETVENGEEITYIIRLTNEGTAPDTVTVKDSIPTGTEFVTGSIRVGSEARPELTAENLSQGIDVTVEAENTNTVEFKVKVVDNDTLENGDKITNIATVNDTPTNEIEHTYIEPIIDATKEQTTENSLAYVVEGETITYTITVTNTGDLGKNVTVRDNIPDGTSFVPDSIVIVENGTPKEGTFTESNLEDGIEVNVGAQNTTTITFRVTVDELPDGTYYAEIVNGAVVDEEPTNDVRVDVYKPHITAIKEAEPEEGTSLTANDSITYTITIRNDGRTDGTTTVKDTIPEGTTFVPGSIKVGGESKAELTQENLSQGINVEVTVGEETTVEFQVTVNDLDNGAIIRNVATYTDEDGEETPTEEVEHPYIEPIINAVKTSETENGLGYVVEGETITYTITVSNTGDLGKLVTIQDQIPEGTTFVEGSIKVDGESREELTQTDLESGIQVNVSEKTEEGAGESTISFEVTVNTLPGEELRAEIVNKAIVDGEETNETTNIVNKADVKAQKTSVPPSGETVEAGEEITYTITVTNDGTAPATAKVTDSIPTGTTFVPESIRVDGANNGNTLTELTDTGIEITLSPDESKTVEFKVTVNDLDNGATIENIALVDGNSTNMVEHTYIEPIISGSKSVETENGLDYVVEGETIAYTITASNIGNADGVVVIKDTIPAGTTFVENSIKIVENTNENSTPKEETYTEDNLTGGIEVKVGAQNQTTVSFQVTVNDLPAGTYEGIIRNTATVNGTDTNEVTEEIQKPNITATKESDPASDLDVTAGNTITYTIKLTNQGTAPGEVIVKDTIPTGTSFVKGSIKVGEQAQTSLTEENLANGITVSLNAGETKNVEFKVTVNDIENGATIRNIASTTNPKTSEETQTNETIHTYVEPIISSTKSQTTENNLDYVVEGEKITYTITVTNAGDLEKNVIVKDEIPEGTTFVEGSINIVENGTEKEGTFTKDNLESGIEVNVGAQNETTLTFQVTVNDLPEGIYQSAITNIANVDGTNTNEVTEELKKAHVRIGKTSEPASGEKVTANDEIRYVIVLENKEGTAPSTLVVKDSIPEGTTFVEGSIRVNDTDLGNTLEDLTTDGITVDIPAGETRTVEFKVKVNDLDNGYIIRNKANITNPETQETKDTNEVTHEYVEAIIDAEKEMTTERGLSYVIPGEKITYTIRVQNEGDLSKTLTVQDSIPEGTEFVANSVHLNGMTSNITQEQLENGFEIEVAGKQTVTISFDVTVQDEATEVVNTAVVDQKKTNETRIPVITYEKTAEIIKQTEEDIPEGTITTGDKIKYTIRVNNLGEEAIDSIVVKDTIPEGTTLSNINNDGIINDRNEIKWNVTNLQPETSTEVSFEVTVNYDVAENKVIENVATIDDEETNKVETPYDKPEIKEESSITKIGTEVIKSTEDTITYRLTYNATIKDFVGEGKVTLVDYLPYEIDIENQNLNGGLYNAQEKKITWEEDLGTIDTYTNGDKTVTLNKEITVKYLYGEDAETLSGTIPNRVEGKLELTQPDADNIGQDKIVLEDTKQANFETRVEIPTHITVHHYIEGTNQKVPSKVYGQVVEDEIQEGYVGQSYTTNVSSNIQENYQVVSNSGNVTGTMTRTPIEVIYYYRLQPANIVTNTITKDGTDKIINKDDKVSYTITYNAQITDYVGNARIEIVDYLPYAIDENQSNLHGGTYNPENNTITWEVGLGRINTYTNSEVGNISITRNIEVVFTEMNYTGASFTNRTQGKVILEETKQEEQTPEASKVTETEFVKDITVEKIWDDNNNIKGNRPESVTVSLRADNQELKEVVLNENNKWNYTFTNLPKYTEQGNEISYSAIETETTDGDLEYYSEPVIENFDNENKTTIRITNKYRLMNTDLEASIEKTGTELVTSSSQEVNYNIKYNATVTEYIGASLVTITDHLPYAIDVEKSELDGGIYDSVSNTITWTENIDHINTYENGDYEVNLEKNITVVFTDLDVTARSMVNRVTGTIDLYETEQTNTVATTYETKVEIPGNVVVKYVDKQTGTEIAESEQQTGLAGDTYTTEQKDIYGYTFVESTNNTSGNMIEGTIEVTYYYTRTNAGGVIVHYVDEEGNKLVEDELITGKVADQYQTEQKDIPNYDFVRVEGQTEGELTEEVIEVTYIYKKIPARVIVQYLEKDDTPEDNTDNVVLAEQEIIEGFSGDSYITTRKEIENFQVTVPENEIGTMTREDIYVIYYYERKPSGIVTVKYVDVDTNEEILHKVEDTQEYVTYREQLQGLCGLEYTTQAKDIPYYNFVEELRPSNATGIYTEEDIEVIYYYRKQTFNLSVNKQIERITVNGVEHSLKDGLDQIDVVASQVQETDIVVTYKIVVSNPSEIEGSTKVIESIPDFFRVTDGTSTEWLENGKSLEATVELQPGETKELTVVLRWIRNGDNFGLQINTVVLTNVSNPANYEEINIEDNTSTAEVIFSVKTGGVDTAIIIGTALIIMIGALMITIYLKERKIK